MPDYYPPPPDMKQVPQLLAIRAMMDERLFQDQKHGTILENPHTIGGWILLLESELAEAKLALIKGGAGRNSVRSEIIQLAAVALACLEQHGIHEIHGEGRDL